MTDLETGMVQELNTIRADHGLAPLHLNPKLATAAGQHSREMAVDGYFDHNSVDGTSFSTRISKWYAVAGYSNWTVAENLLWSSPSIGPSGAVNLWMHSGGHRANILNPRFRDVGIGAVYSTTARGAFTHRPVTIITADFGVRH